MWLSGLLDAAASPRRPPQDEKVDPEAKLRAMLGAFFGVEQEQQAADEAAAAASR